MPPTVLNALVALLLCVNGHPARRKRSSEPKDFKERNQGAPCTWESGCCARHPRLRECLPGATARNLALAAHAPPVLEAALRPTAEGSTGQPNPAVGFRNSSDFSSTLQARRGDHAALLNVAHQQSKLAKAAMSPRTMDSIRRVDVGRQEQVAAQFAEATARGHFGMPASLSGVPVLCIGARLGGEVRALKSLGALAIGIDLNPGSDSMDVVAGDMEDIPFANGSFALVYSNVLDHVYNRAALAGEVCRVLRPATPGGAPGGLALMAVFAQGSLDKFSPKGAISENNVGALVAAFAARDLARAGSTLSEHTIRDTGVTATGVPRRPWNQRITTEYFRRGGADWREACRRGAA